MTIRLILLLLSLLCLATGCATTPRQNPAPEFNTWAKQYIAMPFHYVDHQRFHGTLDFYDSDGVMYKAIAGIYDTPKDNFSTFVLVIRRLGDGQYEPVIHLDICREDIDYLSFMIRDEDLLAITFTDYSEDLGWITIGPKACFKLFHDEEMGVLTSDKTICWGDGPDDILGCYAVRQ